MVTLHTSGALQARDIWVAFGFVLTVLVTRPVESSPPRCVHLDVPKSPICEKWGNKTCTELGVI